MLYNLYFSYTNLCTFSAVMVSLSSACLHSSVWNKLSFLPFPSSPSTDVSTSRKLSSPPASVVLPIVLSIPHCPDAVALLVSILRLGMLSQGQSSGNRPSPSLGHRWMGNAVKIGCEQGQGVRHTVVWSCLHGTDSSRSLMEPQLGNGSFIPAFQASPGRCRDVCRNQQVRLSSSIAFFKPFVCKHMQSTTPHIVKGNSHLPLHANL